MTQKLTNKPSPRTKKYGARKHSGKIPKRVKIGLFWVDVERVEQLEGDNIGLFLPVQQKIQVLDGMSDDLQEQVFWHEAVHGLNSVWSLRLKEDEDVDRVATAVLTFLKENDLLK